MTLIIEDDERHDEPEYDLEAEIERWCRYAERRRGVDGSDVDELEDHLRNQIDELQASGLLPDEAFFISVKRLGCLDDLSREFAQEHSERLWKQLVLTGERGDVETPADRRELTTVLVLALAAALSVKVPELYGHPLGEDESGGFYARNFSFFALPFIAGYFGWKRGIGRVTTGVVVAMFAIGAMFANVYPFGGQGHTQALTAIHLPIALWLPVGITYLGDRWRDARARMDFIRFTGEWFVYYVLLNLGGYLLIGVTAGVFSAIEVDTEDFIFLWLLPCGAAAAAVVSAWLVEAKQGVVENIAPVLTKVFTPLFSLVLASFLVSLLVTRTRIDVDRDVLILFDLILVVVLGLLLYSLSARSPSAPPSAADWFSLSLVISALLIDLVVLAGILSRISDFGFSANKTAALGENILLLVNLGWAACLYIMFMTGRRRFESLLNWQTTYLPIVTVWAAFVVLVFPPLFGFD